MEGGGLALSRAFVGQVLPSAGAEDPGQHQPCWNILTKYLMAIGEGTKEVTSSSPSFRSQ